MILTKKHLCTIPSARSSSFNHLEFYNMVPFRFQNCFCLFLSLVFLALKVSAQDYPLWVQGAFEDATVADDTYNSGGTVTVNGFEMNVPKNVLVQFPAAWVPFREFAARKQDFVGYETLVCTLGYRY